MSTVTKVAIGVAAVAAGYLLLKNRAAANQANYYTTDTAPAPAPLPTAASLASRAPVTNQLAKLLHPVIAADTINTAAGHAVGVWRG